MEQRSVSDDEMLKDTLGIYKKLVQRQLLLMKTITELKARCLSQAKFIQTLETSINEKLEGKKN